VAAEAAGVHLPDVEAGETLDDPLGQQLPHPAGACEPVCAEAGRHPEPAYVRRPKDELAVRRESLRAVDQLDHLGIPELGHPHECALHQLLEARPVLGEQLPVEIGRNAVH
jgi:hypothetical protein